jgi:hypothetical protein
MTLFFLRAQATGERSCFSLSHSLACLTLLLKGPFVILQPLLHLTSSALTETARDTSTRMHDPNSFMAAIIVDVNISLHHSHAPLSAEHNYHHIVTTVYLAQYIPLNLMMAIQV